MRGASYGLMMLAGIAHLVPGCPAFVPGIRLYGHGRSLTDRSHPLSVRSRFWRIKSGHETV